MLALRGERARSLVTEQVVNEGPSLSRRGRPQSKDGDLWDPIE